MTIVTDRSAGSVSQYFPTTLVYFIGSEESGIEDLNIFQQLLISDCPTRSTSDGLIWRKEIGAPDR